MGRERKEVEKQKRKVLYSNVHLVNIPNKGEDNEKKFIRLRKVLKLTRQIRPSTAIPIRSEHCWVEEILTWWDSCKSFREV